MQKLIISCNKSRGKKASPKGVSHHLNKGQASGELLHEGQHCDAQMQAAAASKHRIQRIQLTSPLER